MTDSLKSNYYDPAVGLSTANALYKKLNGKYSLKEIHEFIQMQEADQLHRPPPKKVLYPIIGKVGTFQADLTFYEQYKKSNGGYYVILTVIDINSRKAYARAMKNKIEDTVIEAFQDILKEGADIKIVGFDAGSEFQTKFKNMLKKNSIDFYVADAGDKNKMAMIERFNRTIRDRIEKYLTAYKTNRWIDVLHLLVKNYNDTVHSSTGLAPNDVTSVDAERISHERKLKAFEVMNNTESYKIGDKVRLLRPKTLFEKGATEKYYSGIYTVSKVNPFSYKITNESGDELKRTVKHYELQRINEVQTFQPPKPQDREKEIQAHKVARALKIEGIDTDLAIPSKREVATKLKKQGLDTENIIEGRRRR